MDEKICKELLSIINDSSIKEESNYSLFLQRSNELFTPGNIGTGTGSIFHDEFIKINNELTNDLSKYKSELFTFSKNLTDCKNLIYPVYKNINSLNIAYSNVLKSIDIVDSFIDLNSCLKGINQSLEENNFEKSCLYISKALKTTKDHSKNINELKKVQEKVFLVIKDEFVKSKGKLKDIIKYTKLFSLIGKLEEGLEIYSEYLINVLENEVESQIRLNITNCQVIKYNKENTNTTFCTLLTLICDTIASCVERNKIFINKFFGKDLMIKFIKKIQIVADKGVNQIIQKYIKDVKTMENINSRMYDMILDEIAVTYERLKIFLEFLKNQAMIKEYGGELEQKSYEDLQDLMGLYMRLNSFFLKKSVEYVKNSFKKEHQKTENTNPNGNTDDKSVNGNIIVGKKDDNDSDSDSDDDSDDGESDGEEKYVEKTSPIIDDFFFIFKKILERSKNTNDKQIMCATINHIDLIINEEIKDVLMEPLKNKEFEDSKVEDLKNDKNFKSVMITLNGISLTSQFLKKLKAGFERKCEIFDQSTNEMIKLSLQNFVTTAIKLNGELESFIDQMIKNKLMDRLDSSLEGFKILNYNISESEFANGSPSEWCRRFINEIDQLFQPYEKFLISVNFDLIVKMCVTTVLRKIRDFVMKKRFSLYGGLQLDQEIRNLQKYFSSKVQGTVREKFIEINQICALLRTSGDYKFLINEYFQLNEKEVKKILSLRTDIKKGE